MAHMHTRPVVDDLHGRYEIADWCSECNPFAWAFYAGYFATLREKRR